MLHICPYHIPPSPHIYRPSVHAHVITLLQASKVSSTMASISGVSLSTPRIVAKAADSPKAQILNSFWLNHPWKKLTTGWSAGRMRVRPTRAAPDQISEKVAESIKNAEEACSDNPVSGECVAAWDEVEELSAAASHAREKQKVTDPLEEFCKDNPETEECRTYED